MQNIFACCLSILAFTECLLCLRHLNNKLEKPRLTQIVTEGVTIEKEFVCEALPVALIGMNKDLMAQYIEFVADRLLVALGCEKHYHVKNPFDWMETISLQYASQPVIFYWVPKPYLNCPGCSMNQVAHCLLVSLNPSLHL